MQQLHTDAIFETSRRCISFFGGMMHVFIVSAVAFLCDAFDDCLGPSTLWPHQNGLYEEISAAPNIQISFESKQK